MFDVTWDPKRKWDWYYCAHHQYIAEQAHHESILHINGGRTFKCRICFLIVEGTANGEANRFEPGGAQQRRGSTPLPSANGR